MVNQNELVNRLKSEFGATQKTAQSIAVKAVKFEPVFEKDMDSKFTNELIISKMNEYSNDYASISWNWYVGQLAFITGVDKEQFKV